MNASKSRLAILIGNPNTGKTTLFNALTGKSETVGNWSGVTVAEARGKFEYKDDDVCHDASNDVHNNSCVVDVVDLPGCYSLCQASHTPLDENITQEFLRLENPDIIINVVDASQLERHLHLTLQLLEQGKPLVLAVNMMDAATKKGLYLDLEKLSKVLNIPVIPMVAIQKKGIPELKKTLISLKLESNESSESLSLLKKQSLEQFGSTAKSRFEAIQSIMKTVVTYPQENEADGTLKDKTIENRTISWTEHFDKWILNRFFGLPLFFGLMYLMFFITVQFGSVIQDSVSLFLQDLLVTKTASLAVSWNAPDWVVAFCSQGLGQGIHTTLSFVPSIFTLFLCLSFLEASGYMARAALMVDRAMQWLGLSGKSFVPMIIGFGCNVPAILAARTLENPQERIKTILLTPFMSCSARLAIYTFFVTAFFKEGGQNIIFGLYIIGILVALFTGFLLKKTVLKDANSSLIMELPPYRLPNLSGLVLNAWQRLKRFIIRAGVIIVPVCVLIGTSSALQTTGNESWLTATGKALTPLFAPMGIEESNWPATVGLITGVLAKEVVVGTLTALYSLNATTTDVQGVMSSLFGSTYAAMAYLLFVLLYFPCVSVVATIARELNKKWALFSVFWTTFIAYAVAVSFYQMATILDHPFQSSLWILGMLGSLTLVFLGLRKWSLDRQNKRYLLKPLPTRLLIHR